MAKPLPRIPVVTILDCALAVKAIYKNLDFDGYQLMQGFYDPKNKAVKMEGYSLGVYKSKRFSDNIIVSLRGSAKKPWTKDWVDDDLDIGLGRTPDRTNNAYDYMREVKRLYEHASPNAKIMVTGHSLGGWLAQYIGVRCSLPFITFNAPPALGWRSGHFPDGTRIGTYNRGLNYRVNYDPVSKVPGDHVGPIVTLPLNGEKHKKAHGGETVIKSVIAAGIGGEDALRMIQTANSVGVPNRLYA